VVDADVRLQETLDHEQKLHGVEDKVRMHAFVVATCALC
jgi:hypothetical protein